MSLKPDPIQPVPEETARIARAAFRKGNPLLGLRDELGRSGFEPAGWWTDGGGRFSLSLWSAAG